MNKIFKYRLKIDNIQFLVTEYRIVKILKVAEQHGELMLWAMVDTSTSYHYLHRTVKIVGTGHEIDVTHNLHYIDTVIMPNGLVWHVFDMGE